MKDEELSNKGRITIPSEDEEAPNKTLKLEQEFKEQQSKKYESRKKLEFKTFR